MPKAKKVAEKPTTIRAMLIARFLEFSQCHEDAGTAFMEKVVKAASNNLSKAEALHGTELMIARGFHYVAAGGAMQMLNSSGVLLSLATKETTYESFRSKLLGIVINYVRCIAPLHQPMQRFESGVTAAVQHGELWFIGLVCDILGNMETDIFKGVPWGKPETTSKGK